MFRRFLKSRDGSVAPLFALTALPLVGLIGAGIDFSRANSVRTALQGALDATALALSKTAQDQTAAQINQSATDTFQALFNRPEARDVQISPQLSSPQQGSFVLTITGSGSVDAMFTQLIGQSTLGFSATTEVLWGIKKLNIALVLDNTGSMAQSAKMTNLKTAAHNLLATLQAAAKSPGDVQVAIVPFATDVNVGTGNIDASWVEWSEWDAANGSCSRSSYTSQASCTSNGKVWTPANRNTWNGCVEDRDQNNDVANAVPMVGSPATLFRAHQAANCPVAMMPLSADWTALNGRIDTMTPTGNTNVTVGLAWGFQLLSPVAPFNAPAPQPDLDKVMVVLTDGTNTQNRWTSSESSIDARTQKACNNIKAANIKLYTVRVIDGDITLLKGCATNPSMYYEVSQASELNSVFGSIAQNLANLRITR